MSDTYHTLYRLRTRGTGLPPSVVLITSVLRTPLRNNFQKSYIDQFEDGDVALVIGFDNQPAWTGTVRVKKTIERTLEIP